MKNPLIFSLLLVMTTHLSGQSTNPAADSLAFEVNAVAAYNNGVLYRRYPIGYRYPRQAATNGTEGKMGFLCTFNEECKVEEIRYFDSLGEGFEEGIAAAMKAVTKIYTAYEYKGCEKLVIREELDYRLN